MSRGGFEKKYGLPPSVLSLKKEGGIKMEAKEPTEAHIMTEYLLSEEDINRIAELINMLVDQVAEAHAMIHEMKHGKEDKGEDTNG